MSLDNYSKYRSTTNFNKNDTKNSQNFKTDLFLVNKEILFVTQKLKQRLALVLKNLKSSKVN